jgi:hypothetical protein
MRSKADIGESQTPAGCKESEIEPWPPDGVSASGFLSGRSETFMAGPDHLLIQEIFVAMSRASKERS